MNKARRGKLHRAINDLTHEDLAAIVKQEFPRAKGPKINTLAKQIMANAHRLEF